MRYQDVVKLKDGRECLIRNGDEGDARAVLEVFTKTHEETDNMLTYPSESNFTVDQEAQWLKGQTESDNAIELVALVDGTIVGTAGIEPVGSKEKIRHRATFGIGILREYWGLGVGRVLTEACIACAHQAGYKQLELDVVSENERAIGLYRSLGFVEYGRNPRGFKSRTRGWQELVLMRRELN